MSRGGVGLSGPAELQVHVCREAAGEGNKTRQNRFPSLGSGGPLCQSSWAKRERDTPRGRAPTLTRGALGTDAWGEEARWT